MRNMKDNNCMGIVHLVRSEVLIWAGFSTQLMIRSGDAWFRGGGMK